MDTINLFGLKLSHEPSPVLQFKNGVSTQCWEASLSGNELRLDIRLIIGRRYYLRLGGTFQLRRLSATTWGFQSGEPGVFWFTDGPPVGRNPFEFVAAWMIARGSEAKFTVIDNGYLAVEMPLSRFVQNRELPVRLRSTGNCELTLVLDPNAGPAGFTFTKPSLWFSERSFMLETHIGAQVGNHVHRLYQQDWITKDVLIARIATLDRWRELKFSREHRTDHAEGYTPLHGFRWPTGSVSPCIGLYTNELSIRVGRWDDNYLLKQIWTKRGELRCYAYHNQSYCPLDWSFGSGNSKLALAIQPLRAGTNIACLIVYPVHEETPITLRRLGSSEPILGFKTATRYDIGVSAKLSTPLKLDYEGPLIPGVSRTLFYRTTGPVLTPGSFPTLQLAKAGDAYVVGNSLDTWDFSSSNSNGSLPLLIDEASGITADFQETYHQIINESLSDYHDKIRKITHESNMIAGQDTIGNSVGIAAFLGAHKPPMLSKYEIDYQFGVVKFRHAWSESEDTDHFIVYNDGKSSINIDKSFTLDPTLLESQRINAKTDQPSGIPTQNGNHLLALVKLARGRTLEVLLQEGGIKGEELDTLLAQIPETIKGKEWIGCVLFRQKIDVSGFSLLDSLVEDGLELNYLAISPAKGDEKNFSVYGRLIYENKGELTPHPNSDVLPTPTPETREVLMQTRKLDITWSDRRMVTFHSESLVLVRTCIGLARKNEDHDEPSPSKIYIIGAIDADTETIKFLARSHKPVPLLPEGGFGPIKQLYASRIEVIRINGRSKVDIDGDVEFQRFDVDGDSWFDAFPGDGVKFKGFGFLFDKLKSAGSWFEFDYPSFQFNLGKGGYSLLSLPSIKIQLKGIGIDFPNSGFDWNSLVPVFKGWENNWDNLKRSFAGRFRLGFKLSRLPLLNAKSFEALTFDFHIGIGFKDMFEFDLSQIKLYLTALGFKKLNLDLMRFLTVRADTIELEPKMIGNTKVPWFRFEGVQVDILEKPVINNLTFHYFSVPDGENGFLGILHPDTDVDLILIQIDWVLIGHNLSIPTELSKTITSIKSDWDEELRRKLQCAYNRNELIPLSLQNKRDLGDWIFAAGFRVLDGLLSGKFLFQDNAYYGISLEGKLFEYWFGWKFAISVLYIQRDRPEEDSFYIEIRVPHVSMGALGFKGGVVALEIQMNGGFLLDIGFPWLDAGGVRNWDRSQGIFMSGLMGKGGLYITKRTTVRVFDAGSDGKLVMLGAGQAAMVGIGGAYQRGPFRVEAYAGVYIVAEGAILLRDTNVVGLRLVGSVGIQVRGVGELIWWIISIRVEVVIGAEARLTLTWGMDFDPATGKVDNPNTPLPDNPIEVQLEFVLYAKVSARACIGKGWFKICKSISTGVSLPYRQHLRLGG